MHLNKILILKKNIYTRFVVCKILNVVYDSDIYF